MTQDTTTIRADQLTEGDIIQHRTGEDWLIITEPEYTTKGISFEVLCLGVEVPNTQTMCFAPETSFVLLDHQGTIRSKHSAGEIAVFEERLAS
jgi:hypothetical protein